MATAGEGVVATFTESGTFIKNLVTGGPLASPWGMAIAPAGFGAFGGDLLVGNFSFVDGDVINAFNPTTGMFEGAIDVNPGTGNTPGGLWDLIFGSGGPSRRPNDPLLHRWRQRGDGWPVRRDISAGALDLGHGAPRLRGPRLRRLARRRMSLTNA